MDQLLIEAEATEITLDTNDAELENIAEYFIFDLRRWSQSRKCGKKSRKNQVPENLKISIKLTILIFFFKFPVKRMKKERGLSGGTLNFVIY